MPGGIVPRGLKPADSSDALTARLKRSRKNSLRWSRFPSAAEAGIDFASVMARLEAAPFQIGAADRVFPQPLKPCPDTDHRECPRDVSCGRSTGGLATSAPYLRGLARSRPGMPR